MYSLLSKISQIISGPITVFLNSYEHSPFIIAILLGLVGALAPCQLTGNMSAITFYGNRTLQMKNNWQEIVFFILGKVVVFSLIGFFAWLFGQSFETEMTKYFPIFRKAIGPIMLITGLVLIGILKLKFLNRIPKYIPSVLKEGKLGSFLMGASFSIAFCPTMFVLFFVWLMPPVATSSYGVVLPAIFGIATSVPLLVMLGLIHFFDAKRFIMRTSMKMGRVIQIVAGVILIFIGVTDTITYWGLY
ncbi:sulfite exporter TauE/SafE family protein [Lysinibacillus sp. NPDC056232]|uniref:urease accessory protein UreH domain-containing protein n=1 Tax=Lysinibacillus sp. NPDC056232 TaxID=3345756 RepID=UPI0035E194BC